MRGAIRGLTIEIGGDTTKLQAALKGVNYEVVNTQKQLKDVEKLLKLQELFIRVLIHVGKHLIIDIDACS